MSTASTASTAVADPIRTEGLRYAFGDHVAVDGLDLALHRGEVFGLLGPDGAGRTTTIRVIKTLLPAPPGRPPAPRSQARRGDARRAHDRPGARGDPSTNVQPHPRHPDRLDALPGLPRPGDPRAVQVMPGWLRVINRVNPLSYEVDALRGLLVGTPARLGLDAVVLVVAAVVMISIASALLPRLARG